MEAKYGDSELYHEIVEEPFFPVEINLWHLSFHGVAGEETNLPYVLAHIWTYLLEVGPSNSNGMGPVEISFVEIQAWLSCTGVKLSRWEISLLRQCSKVWISAQYEAKKPNAIPPWNSSPSPEAMAERRKFVAKSFKRMGRKNKK